MEPVSETVGLCEFTDALGRMVFVSVGKLERELELAVRGADGRYSWIELSGRFHSEMVGHCKGAVSSCFVGLRIPLSAIKRAMFEFLLRILNGQQAAVFRLDQKVARDHNRVNRERKRLARKRSRAAKRERAREAELVTRSTASCKSKKAQTSRPGHPNRKVGTKCASCGKSFRSRKRRDRHVCRHLRKKERESSPTSAKTGVSGITGASSKTMGIGGQRGPTGAQTGPPLSGQSLEEAVVRLERAATRRMDVHGQLMAVPTSVSIVVPTIGPASDGAPTQLSNASVIVGSRLALPPSDGEWVYDPRTGWTERIRDPTIEEIEEALRQA